MAKTVSLKEAQATYSLSLNKTELTQGPLILEHEGEPIAAVVPIAEYREFEAWRERHISPPLSPDNEWEQARQAFERMRSKLLKTHRGQFVAILNNQVVDADAEIGTLARRVYARFGYRPIYMQKVTEQSRVARFFHLFHPHPQRQRPDLRAARSLTASSSLQERILSNR